MGTEYSAAIELCSLQRPWVRVASFDLGKAYAFSMGIDWWQPIRPPGRVEGWTSHAGRLGFVFSRCPSCAGDLDGAPGAYVCRTCKLPCTRAAKFNAEGERYRGDEPEAPPPSFPRWQGGDVDRSGEFDEYQCATLHGIAPIERVLAFCYATRDRSLLDNYGFALLAAALERGHEIVTLESAATLRVVLWGDQ